MFKLYNYEEFTISLTYIIWGNMYIFAFKSREGMSFINVILHLKSMPFVFLYNI